MCNNLDAPAYWLAVCNNLVPAHVQAQVLSQKEAAKRLANARHSREATLPVMFFGTLEIGWLQVTLSVLELPC